mgnify:CR=1 FL=1
MVVQEIKAAPVVTQSSQQQQYAVVSDVCSVQSEPSSSSRPHELTYRQVQRAISKHSDSSLKSQSAAGDRHHNHNGYHRTNITEPSTLITKRRALQIAIASKYGEMNSGEKFIRYEEEKLSAFLPIAALNI